MTKPAIVAKSVTKRYRRFAHKNQLRTLKSALRTGDGALGGRSARSAEFLQSGGHDFSQVRFLVAVGNLDCFFKLAVFQCTGHFGCKLTRLFAGGRKI